MCYYEGPNGIVTEAYAEAHMSTASVRHVVARVLVIGLAVSEVHMMLSMLRQVVTEV